MFGLVSCGRKPKKKKKQKKNGRIGGGNRALGKIVWLVPNQ